LPCLALPCLALPCLRNSSFSPSTSLMNIRMLPSALSLALATALVFPLSADAQKKEPAPAKKGRAALVIPDVARDEVICFALYTVEDKTLNMTAVLYPLQDGEDRFVRLEIEQEDGDWKEVGKADVVEEGWTAHLRIEGWDHGKNWNYRVRHGAKATYGGLIRKDPVDKEEIVVAAFTGFTAQWQPTATGQITFSCTSLATTSRLLQTSITLRMQCTNPPLTGRNPGSRM
jgi:hypothetical protein